MTQYLIFRGPRFFLSERKSLPATWTVTLLFEDLEPKVTVINGLQTSPPKWVQAAINSHVFCQTSALFQEQPQLLQVLWLKVALSKSERIRKRTVLVLTKSSGFPTHECHTSQPFSTDKERWHQNPKCLAGLPKKIMVTLSKHLLRCSDIEYVYGNGAAFCSTLSCDGDCRHTYRFLGEKQSVGRQWEKGMWGFLWQEKALLRKLIRGNVSSISVKYHHARS